MLIVIFSWLSKAEMAHYWFLSVQKIHEYIKSLPNGVWKAGVLLVCEYRCSNDIKLNPPCVSLCVEKWTSRRRVRLQLRRLTWSPVGGFFFWRRTIDSDAALIWTNSTWMFSNGVSSCSCEPTCFLHCAPQHDGRTEAVIGQQRRSEQEVCVCAGAAPCVASLRSNSDGSEDGTWTVIAFSLSQEGDPYFIYEYAAWSFLIFNKEIWFTDLFLMVLIFSFY